MEIGWQHYECVLVEDHDEGILAVIPAAPDGTPVEIIRQHAACGKRTVRFVAAAKAATSADLPEVPAAKQFLADAALKHRQLGTHSPIPCNRGVYLYIIWGTYEFEMLNARPADGAFPIPNLPPSISALGDAAQFFPAEKFKRFLDTGSFYPAPPDLKYGILR